MCRRVDCSIASAYRIAFIMWNDRTVNVVVRTLIFLVAGMGMILRADSAFVGSRACQACHPSIYATYMRTPMALSSGTVGDGRRPELFNKSAFEHQPSGYQYRVRQGKESYELQWRKASDTDRPWFTKPIRFTWVQELWLEATCGNGTDFSTNRLLPTMRIRANGTWRPATRSTTNHSSQGRPSPAVCNVTPAACNIRR
jgi:hypothetical protein